jgi:hypothetical protein
MSRALPKRKAPGLRAAILGLIRRAVKPACVCDDLRRVQTAPIWRRPNGVDSLRLALVATAGALLIVGAATALQSQSPTALQGAWRTDGYGFAIRGVGDSIAFFEITGISCIPSFRAHRVPPRDGARVVYQLDDASETLEVLRTAGRARPTGDSGAQFLHPPDAASSMVVRPVAVLPATCRQPPVDNPVTNFDIFWETYRENYPFFALRHIDWQATRDQYRPRAIHASPTVLFGLLRAMIEPLHDHHTGLNSNADTTLQFRGGRPDPHPIGDDGRVRVLNIVSTRYLQSPFHDFANGYVSFAMLHDSIAYLRITAFSDYVPDSGYAANQRALDAAMDTIFASTAAWRGLVIDVRINDGGDDPLGVLIASRLATTPYTAYAKVARADPHDPTRMTPRQPSIVEPSTRPGWRGAVVELTSRYSISAAETFTQALMDRRPAIARVGENTQGVFSDNLVRHLPNGWSFFLPNELFLTESGTSFDGAGIPPTIAVPTFTPADLAAGRDPGLERAMVELQRRSGQR